MTGLWNRRSILEGAGTAPAFAPPATIGDRAAIDWRTFRDQSMVDSDVVAVEGAYDRYVDELEGLTGQRLSTPSQRLTEKGGSQRFVKRSRADAYLQEQAQKEFDADIDRLAQQYPELPVKKLEDVWREVGIERAEQRRKQAEITSRTIDAPVTAAGFGATAAAAMTEPLVISSMAFGAPFSAGILRTALIEGGIAAGTEVPIQMMVQAKRQKFGEEASLSEAMTAILAAGAGGFLFGGLVRGAMQAPGGVRALLQRSRELPDNLRTSEVRSAEAYLERVIEAEEATPFVDTPQARAAHDERMTASARALEEDGRVADLPPAPQRVVRQAEPSEPVEGLSGNLAETVATVRRDALQRQEIDEQARGVAETLAPLVEDAEAAAAMLRDLQARPEQAESLLAFLRRTGGIQEEAGELAAIGLTPRTRPGLISKKGRDLDFAALQAQEAGFFPGRDLEGGDRITRNELLDAIREELAGRRLVRAEDEAGQFQARAMNELRESLGAVGIETAGMTPERFRQAVADLVGEIAERDRGAEAARMGRAGADAAEIEERLAMMGEEDLLDETDVLRAYEGREGEMIRVEDETGVRSLTVRQMLDELQRDQDDFDALKLCASGGGRG